MMATTSPPPCHCARRGQGFVTALALSIAALNHSSAQAIEPAPLPPPASRKIDFVKDVQPLLARSCYECHGPDLQKAELRWDTKAIALKGGAHGPVIVPGNSAGSLVIQLVGGLNPDKVMPKKGDRLSPEQIGVLRAWIDQGAIWPDNAGTARVADKRDHWAFKAPVQPAPPKVKGDRSRPHARTGRGILRTRVYVDYATFAEVVGIIVPGRASGSLIAAPDADLTIHLSVQRRSLRPVIGGG
jgi:mono/diheme cytochrome c family protein